jgi:hypothetical protein
MSTFGAEDWFVLYVAWCAGLIVSNGVGLGMFALVAETIGYYCFLKLANQLFQPDAYHSAAITRNALRALPRAVRYG